MARNPKYIHVPEEILMDRSLSPNEKFVLSNIHSVCTGANNNTYRFGNGWIANYLGITRRSASTIVNSLIKKGYLQSQMIYKAKSKQVDYRVLIYVEDPPGRKLPYPLKQISIPPQEVNFQDMNNTIIKSNTMTKGLVERKEKFINAVKKEVKYSEFHDAFIEYWAEDDGKRMAWEVSKSKKGTFKISNRLSTWKRNNHNKGSFNNQSLDEQITERNKNAKIQSVKTLQYIKDAKDQACDEIPNLRAMMKK